MAILTLILAPLASAATVNVTDAPYNAKGDLRSCADMRMTSGSPTLTSSLCNFSAGDVGKFVQVPLAGDGFGTALSAQISGFTDSQHVTLNANAGATVTAATVAFSDLKIANETSLQPTFFVLGAGNVSPCPVSSIGGAKLSQGAMIQ